MQRRIKEVANKSMELRTRKLLLPVRTQLQTMRTSYFGDKTLQKSSHFYFDDSSDSHNVKTSNVGRPLNKVMVVMSGQVGSGKSTLIIRLFEDDQLCPTMSGSDIPTMIEVIEYGKQLRIGEENKVYLSFVDVPGIIGGDEVEERNLALIKHFRRNHLDFKEGDTKVYPNIILLTVNPVDQQLVGRDSNFQKTIRCLLNCKLVDLNKFNLVVVVTNSMSAKTEERRKIKQNIQAALLDEIKISVGIPIVFLKSETATKLSHVNLIEAMIDICTENDDDLCKLIINSYFNPYCPEKKQDVQILNRFPLDSLSTSEIVESLGTLRELRIQSGRKLETFSFSRLGYGYCPKNESIKDKVFQKYENKEQFIGNFPRMFPANITFLPQNEIRSERLTFEQQRSYEDNMAVSYGLDADVKLVVSASSNGRWTKGKSNSAESSTMSFLFETRLGKLRIEDPPENHISESLSKILKDLPDVYSVETAGKFNQFFSKWGTHFITEQHIGGSIKVNCELNASHSSENAQRKVASQLDNVFTTLGSLSPKTELSMTGKTSSGKEMSRHSLVITGGCAQSVPSVADLTPEVFKTWIDSVGDQPVELEHSSKLYPYYNLINSESLREATLAYLDGSLHNIIEGLKVNRSVYASMEPQGIKALASGIIMKQLKRFSS